MSIDAAVGAALVRAGLFRTLARALEYPGADTLAELAAQGRALRAGTVPWPAGLRAAVEGTLDAFAAADAATLGGEHVRLFGPAGTAPLTETSWGDAGRLLGKPAGLADVAGFYRAFAMEPRPGRPSPEDHLALELEFMSLLALKEAWALAEARAPELAITCDAARAFLTDHLGTWVTAWRAALAAADPPAAYARLGDAVCALVAAECGRLRAAPRPAERRVVDREVGGDTLVCPRE